MEGVNEEADDCVPPDNELSPIAEKTELMAEIIPIKNMKINPIPHSTTANILPRYIEKLGRK